MERVMFEEYTATQYGYIRLFSWANACIDFSNETLSVVDCVFIELFIPNLLISNIKKIAAQN